MQWYFNIKSSGKIQSSVGPLHLWSIQVPTTRSFLFCLVFLPLSLILILFVPETAIGTFIILKVKTKQESDGQIKIIQG